MALEEVEQAFLQGLAEGLRDWVGDVVRDTRADIPVGDPRVDPDPGTSLRDEIHVVPFFEGAAVDIIVDTEYAAKVHEDRRLTHPRGGTHHFLENNFKKHLARYENVVGLPVEKRMREQASRARSRRR